MQMIKNSELYIKIENALAEVRPYLQADGGDVFFVEITEEMIVKVRFTGACKNCNLNFQTLKSGVEYSILKAIPEIKEVQSILDEESNF
jgi:Fe-S cluster biogenesis protein NfuA